MKRGVVADGVGRWAVALAIVFSAALVPLTQQSVAAADVLTLQPVADAYVASSNPTANYGTATTQRARVSRAETFLRFNLAAWQGLSISTLTLKLRGVEGNATPLRLSTTDGSWSETAVSWNSRPAPLAALNVAPSLGSSVARFDVKSLFPSGFIDRQTLSLRVATPKDQLVTFSSRETSLQPQLRLEVAARTNQVDLAATADAHANSGSPDTNYGSASSLRADASPKRNAYMKFDLSAWVGRPYESLKLRMAVTAASAPTVSVYAIGSEWAEDTLTWNNRPPGGVLVARVNSSMATGTRTVDVSDAFASRTVESSSLSLRVAGSGSADLIFSSREGATAPVLRLTPGTATPPPSPTPTASPTPSPTVAPTPSPTPTLAPTATPSPTGEPAPLFYFKGHGTDHGVGMPQYGAKARAAGGQTFRQILRAYYTDITLDPLPPEKMTIRVQLANSFVPTETEPARVVARGGAWQSEAFPEQVFPAESYLDMVFTEQGVWQAQVFDPLTGELMAAVETLDLTMSPAEPTTLFYMKFRDSLRKYDLYRGSMRLRVNGSGIQAVNVVNMDDYVRGVIAAEMIPFWPLEALKAQAVAARSYGAGKLRTTGYFDVHPTSVHQVYGGVNMEYGKTNTATQETAGLVVWYGTRIATAYFFDTGGGATENSEYAWPTSNGNPGTVIAYLRGIEDVDANGDPWEKDEPRYEWSGGQFTMAQLSTMFAADSRTNVGAITKLNWHRGVSGRLYKVVLEGKLGTKTVTGAVFTNIYNKHRVSGPELKSTLIYLTPVAP